MKQVFGALFAPVALSACSLPLTQPNVLPTEPSATVRVYREWALISAADDMYFGEDQQYYAKLDNSEHTELVLAAGEKNLVAIAPATDPFFLKLQLEPNSVTCINTYADPGNYVQVLFPILSLAGTIVFTMESVPCDHKNFVERYPVATSVDTTAPN